MSGGSGGGPARRYEAYVGERRLGDRPAALFTTTEAEERLEQLREYRRIQSAALAEAAPRRGRRRPPAGLTASVAGQNWVPIGPNAVLNGQASTLPVVAGRVQDLAISSDGRRIYAATANGGVWRSVDAGDTWEPMSDEFDLDPANQQVTSLSCGAIALVEGADAAHDRLYVGTGEGHAFFGTGTSPSFFGVGMLRSDNGGGAWIQELARPSGPPPPPPPPPPVDALLGASVYALAVDPGNPEHVVAATTRGVYRRTSAASGWVEEALPVIGTGDKVTGVTVGRNGGATEFYVVVSGGRIFRSTAANVWVELVGYPAGAARCSIAATATDPPVLYVASAKSADRTFHNLSLYNLGRAAPIPWEQITGVPDTVFKDQGGYDQALVVDPNDPDTVYIGGAGLDIAGEFTAAIYRLEVDPGPGGPNPASATLIGGGAHADVHALVFRPGSSTELWAGSDGGVWRTTDAKGPKRDQVFQSRNIGLSNMTMMGLGHHPTEEAYGFCGAQDNGGLRYQGDEVWDHQLYGDGGDTVIDWNTGDRLLSVYIRNRVRRAATDAARDKRDEVGPNVADTQFNFYPPLVGTPPSGNPADAAVVALGAEDPLVSTNFGGSWTAMPTRGVAGIKVRSLAFASSSKLWAGWMDGHVAQFDLTGATPPAPFPRAGETRPITSIAIDPADPTGNSIFVTLGGAALLGDRVWHLNSAGPTWTSAGNQLLDVQTNQIVVDPANANRRWVGADLGVWQWDPTPPAQWRPFSFNLPDAAVVDLDLLPGGNLLRASTHGRGVWELDLATPVTPAVELFVRTNRVDARRRPARAGVTVPGKRSVTTTLDQSPDIIVDAPDSNGRYALDPARTPNIVELLGAVERNQVLASVPDAPAVTRVHVVVRNRGVRPANPALDAVRVSLLVGPAGDDDTTAPGQLPAGYEAVVVAGTPIDADGWKTVGVRTLSGLRVGRPGVATFELTSNALPVADEASGKRFVLLALLHHADDPFPAGPTRDPIALVTNERRAAARRVVAARARGAAAGGGGGGAAGGAPTNPAGGTGLLVPVTAALLAHQRLTDVVDQLERKVNATRVRPGFGTPRDVVVHPVERRVLTMATVARDTMRAGPPAPVPPRLPGAGIGSYAVLGALGFELPGFTSILAPGGAWVADYVRRGTPDVHRSLVKVPSSEFPLAVGRHGLAGAGADVAAQDAVKAFTTGMLAAAAAGITVGPQLADLLARDTNADWHRHSASSGAAALERHLRRRFLGGDDRPSTLATWLPAAGDVPAVLWESYVKALAEIYGLPAQRVLGFPAFEDGFDAGDAITGVRLKNAYGLVLDDLRTSSWPWPAWWGLLTPVLLAPSFAMLIARELPNAKAFFEQGATVTERSVFELLTVSMGLGSIAPFIYSMILWGAIDEHTEVFVTALLMFLARAGLVAGGLGTAGDADQSELVRWLAIFLPLAGLDVYALIRAAIANNRRPGVSTVFAFQTIPALTGLTTLGVTALLKALGISDDWPFWLSWTLHALGMWLGVGIPVAVALSNGGGWRSWFMRDDRRFPLLSSVAAAAVVPPEPLARARVFDASGLWPDPAAAAPVDVSAFAYPTGMRPLVKVWWEGDGSLEVSHDADLVTFRAGGVGGAATPVRLPIGSTAASVATLLAAALVGVKAKVVKDGAPDPALPWPRSLADPGDPGPAADAVVARSRFVPVGDKEDEAVVLLAAPRAELSTAVGLVTERPEAFPVLPVAALGDLEGAGLGAAADLATLLAVAAAPSFGPLAVADALPALPAPAITEVVQVFRRWNLDERRLEEWQALVTGGAPVEGPLAPEPLVRTPPGGYLGAQPVGADLASAMGWIPMWRAWLRVASDTSANADAPFAMASTPLVRFPDGSVRRPTNAQLTEGVRFLLDLGAA